MPTALAGRRHPDHDEHPAIETTTGPLGQGLATAVGMAIAERNMAARFGKSLVDHRTWVMASNGDMMEGISHEAASLAGQLGLSRLTVLCDDAYAPIDGTMSPLNVEDVLKRFAAYGWANQAGKRTRSSAGECSLVVRRPLQEAHAHRLSYHHRSQHRRS